MADACRAPEIEMAACLLRLGAEDSIPAAHIRHHWMRAPAMVPQFHTMLFARPAAIAIAGPIRKKTAEHAMLSMEDRQMLIRYSLEILRARIPGEVRNL